MREILQRRCNLFIENRDVIKSNFKWESSYIHPLCAWLYASKDKSADIQKMRQCLDLLKEKTGIFSNFRGVSKMAVVTMLANSQNPEERIDNMLTVYENLKDLFWGSQYLAVTASIVAEFAQPSEYAMIAERTRSIYNLMKSAHPFLTSGEDNTFAALLALSGIDQNVIDIEMEKCYEILKRYFFSSNSVQSLSHILALGEKSADEKCKKTIELFEYLKRNRYKYGTGYELATLGVLALVDVDINILADDIMQTDDFLKSQKGFFSIGSKQRLMYAGMLTMSDYMPIIHTMQAAALNGVVSLVIAQQAAVAASIAASSVAASASSSSS